MSASMEHIEEFARQAEHRAVEAEKRASDALDRAEKYLRRAHSAEAQLVSLQNQTGPMRRANNDLQEDLADSMEVITALEQYVREAEAERTRLLARNAFLEAAYRELRTQLEENPNGTPD